MLLINDCRNQKNLKERCILMGNAASKKSLTGAEAMDFLNTKNNNMKSVEEEFRNEEAEKTEVLAEISQMIKEISSEKETTDYDSLKLGTYGNRDPFLPEGVKKVKILEASMIRCGFMTTIIVDQYGNVLDGQHRLVAARNIGIPVKYKTIYLLKTEYARPIILLLNDTGSKLKVENYLGMWGHLPSYTTLQQLIADSGFNFFHVATLCGNVRGSKKFRSGEFDFTEEHQKKVKTKIKQIKKILDCNSYIQDLCKSKTTKAAIIGALVIIVRDDAYDHERMLTKLQTNYTMLSPKYGRKSTSAVEYVIQFEQIYNKSMKKGAHVFSKTHN